MRSPGIFATATEPATTTAALTDPDHAAAGNGGRGRRKSAPFSTASSSHCSPVVAVMTIVDCIATVSVIVLVVAIGGSDSTSGAATFLMKSFVPP